MPTKDLWFLPKSGPGRNYLLEYDPLPMPDAGMALRMSMFRKFAAGEVATDPMHTIVLAFSVLAMGQLARTHQADAAAVLAFLERTAERAASCLDMRLPPPIEPPVEKGLVVWLSTGDYASERTLTQTLVTLLG